MALRRWKTHCDMRVSVVAADGGRGQEEGREMSESITEGLRFMSEDLVSIAGCIRRLAEREASNGTD